MNKENQPEVNLPEREKRGREEIIKHHKFGRVFSIQEEVYDANGVLQGERWKNAKGIIVETMEFIRDEIGRITKEVWKDNEGNPYFINEYKYDKEGKQKGQYPKRLTKYDPEPLYEEAYSN